MQFLRVSKAADLRPLTNKSLPGTTLREDVIVIFDKSKISLPMDWPGDPGPWAFENLNNCYFFGATSPRGKTLITGYPFVLLDCQDVYVSTCAFRLDRPAIDPSKYEKWWNSPKLLASAPDDLSKNIEFFRCSMSGNTDEIDCGPANYNTWPKQGVAHNNLIFSDCFIGPSFKGKSPNRLNHNFGLGLTYVTNFTISGCVFAGHNRRAPQIKGTGQIKDCLINGYGTMAIGIHNDSDVDIQNVICIPDLMTPVSWSGDPAKNRVPPIQVVTGTPFDGRIQLFIDEVYEVFTTKKHGASNVNSPKVSRPRANWDNFLNTEGVTVLAKPRSTSPVVRNGCPWGALNSAGVRDSLDKAVAIRIRDGSMPWVFNPGEAGLPDPISDYASKSTDVPFTLSVGSDSRIIGVLKAWGA